MGDTYYYNNLYCAVLIPHLVLGAVRPVFSTFCCPSGDTSGRESGILTFCDRKNKSTMFTQCDDEMYYNMLIFSNVCHKVKELKNANR